MLLAPRYWTALGLSCLLGWLQYQLWQGRGSLPQVESYRQQLAEQLQANEQSRLRNEQLAGEVRDLWYHETGCAQWLVVTRNTVTHEILATELVADRKKKGVRA